MKQKEFFLVIISAFVITVIWIASNIYNSHASSTIDPVLQVQTVPIPPTFDMTTFNELKNRTVVGPAAGVIANDEEEDESLELEESSQSVPTPTLAPPTLESTPTEESQGGIITETLSPTTGPQL